MQDPVSTQTLAFLRQNEIGKRARIPTPFGPRLIFYADLTATGRYLHFVEAWMRHILPFYANTHTAVSSTGSLLTQLREQSRSIVHAAVQAGPEHEVVFCGSGATAAVNKLVGLLGYAIPEPLERRYQLSDQIPANERPVVLVGPYEHHSNYLPWLESIADVIEIPDDNHGQVDLAELQRQLDLHANRPQRIGAVSHAAVDYVQKLDEREEAGTPAILSDLRAGAAFLVRDMVGAEVIREHELELSRQALDRLAAHPRIQILGPTDARASAFSRFRSSPCTTTWRRRCSITCSGFRTARGVRVRGRTGIGCWGSGMRAPRVIGPLCSVD